MNEFVKDHFVGSWDKMLYDDYLCLMASNNQQMQREEVERESESLKCGQLLST